MLVCAIAEVKLFFRTGFVSLFGSFRDLEGSGVINDRIIKTIIRLSLCVELERLIN